MRVRQRQFPVLNLHIEDTENNLALSVKGGARNSGITLFFKKDPTGIFVVPLHHPGPYN